MSIKINQVSTIDLIDAMTERAYLDYVKLDWNSEIDAIEEIVAYANNYYNRAVTSDEIRTIRAHIIAKIAGDL